MVILERGPSRKLSVPMSWDSLGSKWHNQSLIKYLWFFGTCKSYNCPCSCSH